MNVIKANIAHQESRKSIIWTLAALILGLLIFYAYSINVSVRNVVAHESVLKQVTALRSVVAELEMQQVAVKNTITMDTAHSLGFVEVVEPRFVSYGGQSNASNISFNSTSGR